MSFTVKDRGTTPARVNRVTGEVFVNTWFNQLPDYMQKSILLHENGHYDLQTKNEIEADHYSLQRFAGTDTESLKKHIWTLNRFLDWQNNYKDNQRMKSALLDAMQYDFNVNKNLKLKGMISNFNEEFVYPESNYTESEVAEILDNVELSMNQSSYNDESEELEDYDPLYDSDEDMFSDFGIGIAAATGILSALKKSPMLQKRLAKIKEKRAAKRADPNRKTLISKVIGKIQAKKAAKVAAANSAPTNTMANSAPANNPVFASEPATSETSATPDKGANQDGTPATPANKTTKIVVGGIIAAVIVAVVLFIVFRTKNNG